MLSIVTSKLRVVLANFGINNQTYLTQQSL